jgi:hypothetical protein
MQWLWEVHSYPGAMLPADEDGNHRLPSPDDVRQPALEAMQQSIKAGREASESEFLDRQHALWKEQRQLGIGWKITDLVTLGSR